MSRTSIKYNNISIDNLKKVLVNYNNAINIIKESNDNEDTNEIVSLINIDVEKIPQIILTIETINNDINRALKNVKVGDMNESK